MTTQIPAADVTFGALADLAEIDLPPGLGRDGKLDQGGQPARARAAAQTLRQWARWTSGMQLDMADLAYCYPIMGARLSTDGATRSRRHTCRQLGALAERICGEYPGTEREARAALVRVMAVWDRVAAAQDSSDPRQAAIAARCEEEIETLRGRDGLGLHAGALAD